MAKEIVMTKIQKDRISEFLTIGYQEIQSRLSRFFRREISFELPKWSLCQESEAGQVFSGQSGNAVIVEQKFTGNYNGNGFLIMSKEDAKKIASLLVERNDSDEIDADQKDALKEVGNITINGLVCSADNFLDDEHEFLVPTYILGKADKIVSTFSQGDFFPALVMHTKFRIGTEDLNIIVGLLIGSEGVSVLARRLEEKFAA